MPQAPATAPVPAAPVATAPSTAYQVWQGLQGAVLCDADRLCGPNRAYVRSPVNVGTPTVVTTSPTGATVSGGPVVSASSLPAPPWMQSIGSQGQPMVIPAPAPAAVAPVAGTSGVFVPSPGAAGSPVVASVQPGSGVFVPSPQNASFVQTSIAAGSPVAKVAPAAVPMQPTPAFPNIPAGSEPFAKAKAAAPAKEEPKKRSKKKKTKCCGVC
ncbi:unnamed protein product [Durusdinium trenchii]